MIFITATDTNVGKTYLSNKLIKHLIDNKIFSETELAYFKPVQSGQDGDRECIQALNPKLKTFCTYSFQFPASPDYAAQLENQKIDLQKIITNFNEIKKHFKFIIVEGAGGPAVPLNENHLVSDLIKNLSLKTILVVNPILGSINHTLLALEHLQNKKINTLGIFINSINKNLEDSELERQKASIKSIVHFSQTKILKLEDMYAADFN